MNKTDPVPAGNKGRFVRHLSPLGVWALAFGCAVGWGAFVMPGNYFLHIAGPVGTAIGIAVGALIMVIIGVNYSFLMNRYPESGGTFAFAKHAFGYDHAFLSSWFMGLVYLAIIWANCTALPLIFRKIFGNVLQFGHLYNFGGSEGYEVYLGEVLLSVAALIIFGVVCLRGGRFLSSVQIVSAIILMIGVLLALGFILIRPSASAPLNMQPAFSPDHSAAGGAIFIVFFAPWAFAGFESVSQSTEEFKFPVKKTLRILIGAIISAAAAYIILNFVAASAVPEGYNNWTDYIKDLDNASFKPYQTLPTMNGAFSAAGATGIVVLGLAAAAGIITGLIGNTVAASRLICSMARDDVIGTRMGKINKYGVPRNAVLFLILISLPIPFLGRSATNWIIDINTIGVTIAYAYTSAAALKIGLKERKKFVSVTGGLGIVTSLLFLVYFLVPNEWAKSAGAKLSTESYFMLIAWLLGGFFAFFFIFRRDKGRRVGKSTVVWVVLLVLILATSVIWVRETTNTDTVTAVTHYSEKEQKEFEAHGVSLSEEEIGKNVAELEKEVDSITAKIIRNTMILFSGIAAAMLLIFNIYRRVQKSHQTAVEGKTIAEQSSHAKTTFLSNMSHDIRTPMNAIVGYVTLAKREKDVSPAMSEYLSKIEASSDHLLALINDVLEMSRIESGKMEIAPVPTDLRRMTDDVRNLFSTQMETKGLTFTVTCDVQDAHVLCDVNRFNRVLLNLISNAYKFTPEGGSVTVALSQTGRTDGRASYRVSVKDTGIGMSAEFAAKVFEAYERERTQTVENIQGTGLGTAITKSIVDLMGGTIEVFSEQGKGSEFVINVSFELDPEAVESEEAKAAVSAARSEFAGLCLLLVEDDPENADISKALFEQLGFTVDVAVNGEDAVETIATYAPDKYAAVIMDIEMPVKNGYEAAKLIRSLKNPELAKIPIVALSARAFSEDIAAAREAGMNAHIAKPVNIETLIKTMNEVLS